MNQSKPQSFMANCKDFFGTFPGQTSLAFAAEVKALNDSDRSEIKEGLEKLGYQFTEPQLLAKAA